MEWLGDENRIRCSLIEGTIFLQRIQYCCLYLQSFDGVLAGIISCVILLMDRKSCATLMQSPSISYTKILMGRLKRTVIAPWNLLCCCTPHIIQAAWSFKSLANLVPIFVFQSLRPPFSICNHSSAKMIGNPAKNVHCQANLSEHCTFLGMSIATRQMAEVRRGWYRSLRLHMFWNLPVWNPRDWGEHPYSVAWWGRFDWFVSEKMFRRQKSLMS